LLTNYRGRQRRLRSPLTILMKLKALDFLAILLSLLAVSAFSIAAYAGNDTAQDVVIEASGTRWIYPLNADRQERVAGPLGDTVVIIKGGRAFVEDSPCPDKLCVHMPAISRPGQWIGCLPNRVFVRVRGGSGQDIDELSY
jgi:hypothetical protein